MPPVSIPARVNPAPDPSGDYISRALLSSLLTKSATALVGMFSRTAAAEALAKRVMLASGAAKTSGSPALGVLDKVVESVMQGTDLSPQFPAIARLIHAQDQRAEVISQLVLTNDYARLARATRARDQLEETLCAMAANDELLPAERVLLLDKLESITTATIKAIRAQSTSINDIQAMLEKIDYTTEMAGAGLRKKFEKTSPQGREVVRKLLLSVSKRLGTASKDDDNG